MTKRSFLLLLSLCLLTVTLWAADNDNPFAGKWKLNPSRSRLTDEMKVAAVGPNKYAFNFSGDNVETIVVDGTDQPGLFGTTLAVSADAPDSWRVVRKTGAHIDIIGLWRLSADGSTLTDNFTGFRPDGTTSNLLYTYKRTAGTSGFVGTWESVTEQVNSTFEIQIQPYQDNGISLIFPSVTKNVILDDKDYPNAGASAPPGYTSSGHRVNDHTVQMIDKMNGKLLNTQQVEVSPDGKTLTVTITIPGRNKPQIQVFERE
jgi:hypothetical protein